MKKRKENRSKKLTLNIALILFLILFLISSIKIISWTIDNNNSNKIIKTIKNDIIINKETNKYKIDFDNLKKKNNDTLAFIKINGTNIEYPIVKTTNNDFYLNHSFDKSPNNAGWPFINYINKVDGSDKNITIFAHARRDGSMFGTLYKTLSTEWRNNEENLKILFITETETNYYKVFSTYKILEEDYYIKNNFKDEEEYNSFLTKIKNRSNYEYNINIDKNDRILTLSTCSSDDRYRIVLHAKKLN
ncbi:MAG: class B sortase [Bacilli bacterium]|nr:class B sortase [Bacilli bacterium]